MKNQLTINNQTQVHNIIFMDDGKEVGRLTWKKGLFTFKGKVDKSAELLFRELKRMFENSYEKNI